MKVAVVGRGLIGGSFEKAARRAGHEAVAFGSRDTPEVGDADVVFVAVPPQFVLSCIEAVVPSLKDGAIVVDATGVKRPVYEGMLRHAFEKRWFFVAGHPMAGRERTGYANSVETLFDGASMILTPYPTYGRAPLDRLEKLLRELGFARIVYTDPAHHDEMIAYTSQLCHLMSSAYVRDPLSKDHVGYSAGSFRDMVRVGAPDPKVWTELFFANRGPLLDVLDRYIARLADFREALATDDRARLVAALEEGIEAKKKISDWNPKTEDR